MNPSRNNVLLYGFYSYEVNAMVEEGLDVAACISIMERRELPDLSRFETHDHFRVARCYVNAIFREDFSPDLRRQLYSRAFPLFRRHYHRVAFSFRAAIRSWTNLDHSFHIAASFFYDLVKRKDVRTIVFSNFPHEGAAIILYELARLLGIDTVICTQSLFPDKLWIVRTIDDFGRFVSVEGEGIELAPPPAPETPFYMKNVGQVRKIRGALKVGLEVAKALAKVATGKIVTDVESWDRNMNRLGIALDRNHLGNPGPQFVSQVDLNEPFIYFPLHLQPEMTTDTWAEQYGDQLSALEELAQSLPQTFKIYVKENPVQGRFMRETSFFDRLMAIPNARYVSSEVPTFKLIRKCRFVATITGTAGWEALLLGKSAVIFGYTWYSDLPGVFRWRGPQTVSDALAFQPDRGQFDLGFRKLSKKLYSGVLDKAYYEITDSFDRAGGAAAAAQSIKSVIENRAQARAGKASEYSSPIDVR